MNRFQKRTQRVKVGLPPGSLVFTGQQRMEKTIVKLVQYNETELNMQEAANELPEAAVQPDLITWYDIRGLHQIDIFESIGKRFDIHPLILEDVLDTSQRPKFDEYENGIFIILRSLDFDEATMHIHTEQIGIFVTEQMTISFQEKEEDVFLQVQARLEAGRGKLRRRKSDYLAYALMDNVVDNYLVVLEKIEVEIDRLEEAIMRNPESKVKSRIHSLKLATLSLRKSVHPLREAINRFIDSDHAVKHDDTDIFLRDLYDHTIQVMDMVETYRDIMNGLYDLYLSEISLKMNNVMQVLTIIATIFIPLTFLAGIYGMNFEHIPELHWRYSYYVLWAIMIAIAAGLLYFFRRKNWL